MNKKILMFLAGCDDFETCKQRCNELLKAMPEPVAKPVIKVIKKRGEKK